MSTRSPASSGASSPGAPLRDVFLEQALASGPESMLSVGDALAAMPIAVLLAGEPAQITAP